MNRKPASKTSSSDSTKVAFYARVSTDEQARRESIQTQLTEAKRYCEQNGLDLVATFQDEGVSGSVPFDKRPGGQALLAAADRGEFSLVLVWKVSRLGRQDVVSHIARHSLETRGIGLRSITEPFDTTTPAGAFMFSILSASAAMERAAIRENSRAGLRRIAEKGLWAGGPVPFGYRLVDRRLEPDPEEAPVVQRWFSAVATGQSASQLTREALAAGYKTRRGYPWRLSQVCRILHSEVYSGVCKWRDVTAAVPPLVSRETWQKAQQAITKNIQMQPGRPCRLYPLRGLLTCDFLWPVVHRSKYQVSWQRLSVLQVYFDM